MGDCGNTDYQMIDFSTITDIESAQVVKAQINSIDQDNNTADINLLDSTCEILSGLDLTEVEFFYHCEDSVGTLEDLATGWRAFRTGDIVYVIYIPENGDVAERFFIIGHVDIKGTNICEIAEYLVFKTTNSYTIFDTAVGTTLDLNSFDNIDAGSPPKPTRLPFIPGDTDYLNDWLNYNFSPSSGGATIGGSIYELDLASSGTTTDINENTTSPVGSDPGTHTYNLLEHRTNDPNYTIHNETYQYGSDYMGSFYGYGNMETTVKYNITTGHSEGIEIYDSTVSAYRYIYLSRISSIESIGTHEYVSYDSLLWDTYYATKCYSSESVKVSTNFDSTNETLWSIGGGFTGSNGYPNGPVRPALFLLSSGASVTTDILGGALNTSKTNNVPLDSVSAERHQISITGDLGFYFLHYYSVAAMEFNADNVTVCSPRVASTNVGQLWTNMGGHNYLYCYTPDSTGNGITPVAVKVVYPLISMFSTLDTSSTVGMFDVIDNRNATKSAGLSACIKDLLDAEFLSCEIPEYGNLTDGITEAIAYRKKSDIE